jgi:hypothetical protein
MQYVEPVMPWLLGPNYPQWTDLLPDQRQILIRPIGVKDAEAERRFIESLSPQTRRFRFLGQIRRPSNKTIKQFTDLDYVHDVAFAAVIANGDNDQFVGVSRYTTTADGTECEYAITVQDRRIWSLDSAEDVAGFELASSLGFEHQRDPDDSSQMIFSLWL